MKIVGGLKGGLQRNHFKRKRDMPRGMKHLYTKREEKPLTYPHSI
jgi:hypothetical protein